MKFVKNRDLLVHAVAISIAVLGPLFNLLLGYPYSAPPPAMYLYWSIALLIYVCILLPLTFRSPLTLAKLVFLGIALEDFFSNLWRHLFLGKGFLPFENWYTQHFPFLGSLGEPAPIILIPKWYLVAFSAYLLITIFQHRKRIKKFVKVKKI